MNGLFGIGCLLLSLFQFASAVHAIITRRPRRFDQRRYEREIDRCVAEWKRQIRAGQERSSQNGYRH
jgi:hypothetical protein